MNTAIIPEAHGLGFAVAANSLRRAVDDIQQHGHVIRPWIGVSMVTLTPPVVEEVQLPRRDQELVAIVRSQLGGPAERAGLKEGDVITEANGRRVTDADTFRQVIHGLKPGGTLTLKGVRGGREQAWTITVGEMPDLRKLES